MASPGLAQICSRYIIDRNFDKAIQELDIFLKANPADSELWNSRGWLLMQEGKHREAIECFEKAKNLDSQNAHALNNEGLANCNLGDYEKAISNFDQALGIDKNYANAWNNKGLAQYYLAAEKHREEKREIFLEAISSFEKAIEINSAHDNAWNNKGTVLLGLGLHDEAVKCIDKSLEINSNNTDAWNNRGRALAQQERWEEAIYYYDKAISKRKKDEKAPEHVAALNNKGISLAQIANYNNNELKRTESDKCYDRALATDSKFVKALNNKSMLYLDRGDAESAERLINDSLKIDGSLPETLDKKGLILFHRKRYNDALDYFKKANDSDPDYLPALYHIGNVQRELGHLDKAISFYDRALDLDPTFAEAYNGKALALYYKKDYKNAVKEATKALRFKPSLMVAEENLAKLSSPGGGHRSFWEFWNSSRFRKVVGIMLVSLAISLVILFAASHVSIAIQQQLTGGTRSVEWTQTIGNASFVTKIDNSPRQMPETFLVAIGVVLFILFIPEIVKAKIGPLEIELKDQHVHPTTESPSLSENLDQKTFMIPGML